MVAAPVLVPPATPARSALPAAPAPAQPALVVVLADRASAPAAWDARNLRPHWPTTGDYPRLLATPPAAVVLDVSQADARQTALCWQLHDLFDVPIIVVAEGAASDVMLSLLVQGATDVLTGPVTTSLVAATVAAVLRRHRRPAGDCPAERVVRLGAVEVDVTERVVRRPEGTHSLSRTEFTLLQALLLAQGRVCTQRALITQVWGIESASAPQYLRLYIRYLREKLEADPHTPRYLLNVWGKGYRLTRDAAAAN